MSESIVHCSACGEALDASRLAPGSRFPCARCGGMVAVPGRAIVAALARRKSRLVVPLGVLGLALVGAAALLGDGGAPAGGEKVRTAEAPPERESWWARATTRASGAERILAPRELVALLEEGRRLGFAADAAWWAERERYASERILELDPDDESANRAAGRRVLQDFPGFASLWERILGTRASHPTIDALLDAYDFRVQANRPVFLDEDAWARAAAWLADAKAHLDRLDADPEYAALRSVFQTIRGDGALHGYPHVHVRAGPFVVFYTARDLARIPGEDEHAEAKRLEALREKYRIALEPLRKAYEALLEDVRTSYPELWAARPLGPGDLFVQWIFAEESLYRDFCERTAARAVVRPGRAGHFRRKDGWAFLYEPEPPSQAEPSDAKGPAEKPDAHPLAETAAYLGAWQLLHRWSTDPKSPRTRHLDTARALWVQEGFAAWLAARRVSKSAVGGVVRAALAKRRPLPPVERVVDRESWHELAAYREPVETGEHDDAPPLTVAEAFTDLAWLLTEVVREEPRRAAYVRLFRAQLEGRKEDFRECFGISRHEDWKPLDEAVRARAQG